MRRWNGMRVNTRVKDWIYIPSQINIADTLSRGISFDKFHLLSTWFAGPEFLVSNNQNYGSEGLMDKTKDKPYVMSLIKLSVMKCVSKLLKTTSVTLMLTRPMLTQTTLVLTNILGILFVLDQNQAIFHIVNKTQIQLVEMETKTIRPQKLQLFTLKELNGSEYTYLKEHNKILIQTNLISYCVAKTYTRVVKL